jgi:hypothetical protein
MGICDFSCIWGEVGQSIGMAKKKKAQMLETRRATISKEPSTVKGNIIRAQDTGSAP